MFFLGEYVNTVTVAAVAVTLFLGGWRGYWPFHGAVAWVGPFLWFILKLTAVIYVMILVRATLPRMRYDRLMNFGWKVLIPFGLVWVMITGARGRAARPLRPARDLDRRRDRARRRGAAVADRPALHVRARARRCGHERSLRAETPQRVPRRCLGDGQGHGHGVQADVPPRQHRAVPEGDRADPRALAHRPAPAEPARGRAGEVHRVRALRLRVPRRRDLGGGRGQRSRAPGEPGRAAREGLPDQLPALHHVRPLRRGLPHARAHAHELLRAGLHLSRGRDLDQGAAAREAAAAGHRPRRTGRARCRSTTSSSGSSRRSRWPRRSACS